MGCSNLPISLAPSRPPDGWSPTSPFAFECPGRISRNLLPALLEKDEGITSRIITTCTQAKKYCTWTVPGDHGGIHQAHRIRQYHSSDFVNDRDATSLPVTFTIASSQWSLGGGLAWSTCCLIASHCMHPALSDLGIHLYSVLYHLIGMPSCLPHDNHTMRCSPSDLPRR